MAIRRIGEPGPSRIGRVETPERPPITGEPIPLEALCDLIDDLPDEATHVVFVSTEEGLELFYHGGETWTRFAIIRRHETASDPVLPDIE